jgi:hypothetical protein
MNRYRDWVMVGAAALALVTPAASLAQRPGPFPLPPPGPADGPAQPGNATEKALGGSWVAQRTLNGTPGYYHFQFFQHVNGTFQDKSGSYLGDRRWDWSAQPVDQRRFVLTVGDKRWSCVWDGPNSFKMRADNGSDVTFYRNPWPGP